jgi:hypothetical protein
VLVKEEDEMGESDGVATKECMWCAEDIKVNAKFCRFCNREQTAPEQPGAEDVLYEGPGHFPIEVFLVDLLLCCLCIGMITGVMHWWEYHNRRYIITTKRVELSRGTLLRQRIDTLELFRIHDIRYVSSWGRGTIILSSNDASSPILRLGIPNARQVFDKLKVAVDQARKEAGVMVRESM